MKQKLLGYIGIFLLIIPALFLTTLGFILDPVIASVILSFISITIGGIIVEKYYV